ncbi:hypothetical protein MSAS_17980 [Mycobacterium saskatchewanense]|uniref:Uncharacterized protein n=1 Tax=Mycobacterium saskatchewanense TaxID=220927 RepID=A0AAJ3TVZ8_9MYCO|nr:DMT family transporter [Mycobacterium saskatchewanense]ORW72857.1 hypothetical protein AWC23_08315 [Mycobacterium saskatchewanense]BBX62624.1 hypothetical protein MSAS_17980 [Mycobacterium saskatchewanense]
MPHTGIAALLALASALCIATGDVLQQRAAHRITDPSVGHIALFVRLLRNRRWLWGALLLAASIALQAAALGQGSVLLVQALLMLSVLFALPINARLSHRTVAAGEWVWAGLLTAAVIVIVIVGNPNAGRSGASLKTWAWVAVVLGPVLIGCVIAGRIWGGAAAAVLFAFVSGSLWGVFAVLTKEVVARLSDDWAVVRTPELYACVLVAVGGIVWSQAAFRAGPLTASMPMLAMSQPVVAALLGVVVLGETLGTGRAGMATFAAAVLVMTAAIVKLARVDAVATRERVDAHLQDVIDQRV